MFGIVYLKRLVESIETQRTLIVMRFETVIVKVIYFEIKLFPVLFMSRCSLGVSVLTIASDI